MSRRVVLVHGLWYGSLGMALLKRRLERAGFVCHSFSYSTLSRSLATNASALFEFARSLEADPLDFVGHSLGGLVILRMFDEFGPLPPGRVVLLGSPVRGSAVAGRAVEMPLIRPLVGRARSALEYGFEAAPPGRETGVVTGTANVGVGRLFNRLDGPGDGVVSVAECRLDGSADECSLPVSHTGLVLSRRAATAVGRFLMSGRFSR